LKFGEAKPRTIPVEAREPNSWSKKMNPLGVPVISMPGQTVGSAVGLHVAAEPRFVADSKSTVTFVPTALTGAATKELSMSLTMSTAETVLFIFHYPF
jgi:hypothetical protein